MQIIRNVDNIKEDLLHGAALTIGDFDGFHLGHQALVDTIVKSAKALNVSSAILIFEPQPREYFAKLDHPCRLTTLREKILHFERSGIDTIIIQAFNKKFASITAEKFIEDILVERIKVKKIIIGHDFKFGNNRTGDFELLENNGKKHSFSVERVLACTRDDHVISSSLIRDLLFIHNFDQVERLLGRKYSIVGRINQINRIEKPCNLVIGGLSIKNHKFPLQSGIYKVKINYLTNPSKYTKCIVSNSFNDRPIIYIDISLLDYNDIPYRESIFIEFDKYLDSSNLVLSKHMYKMEQVAEVFTAKK